VTEALVNNRAIVYESEEAYRLPAVLKPEVPRQLQKHWIWDLSAQMIARW